MRRVLLFLLLIAMSPFAEAVPQLHLFNWNNYIAEETLAAFEAECGCQVVQDYYSSTEEMMAKLQAGARGYDVVFPTQNAVSVLIKQGMLAPLDRALLPNFKNMEPLFLDRSFDPDNRYSVPYAYTTTLIGYNEERLAALGIAADDWSVIFDPRILQKIRGKVTVMDDVEELFAAALKYLGYSVNDRDPKHLREAQQLIISAKPYWAAFNSSSYIKELTVGNIWVAHGYSSDMMQARNDARASRRKFTINFVLPKQGAVIALDSMVIPVSSSNKALAHRFINFMMDGRNGAVLSNKIGAGNPNGAAMPYINDEIRKLTAIFPSRNDLARLESLETSSAKDRRYMNRLWTEAKVK